ncbi:aminodeoxychorismate synthase component 1 [Photobacterium sp. 1_MG-2023]|uniref:aminodeoxychorismate synthase component 1 n=1 Tax=Photobacterium sp. 1_MG-2023 TaxID=3062646 RepID=UPI0026E364E6|nr:aminodeoxychorismate synthase component 1 [Photobacterium sp. 1_MG-2023]MDO6706628.1 aminodeoxychorismate synthase component 1 [Photobacterium sp. 1_MG-2023]
MKYSAASQLQVEQLDYRKDALLSWFEPLSAQPWAMLLRSAAEGHPDNRYDILVADPIATLESRGQMNTITDRDGNQDIRQQDPFALLNELQQALLPETDTVADLPFVGGALGYFAYDLGRQVEKMPSLAMQDIQAPEMAVGLYNWALIADHHLQRLTLVAPDTTERLHWLNQQHAPAQASPAFALTSEWQANMTVDNYTSKFNQVQDYLKAGDCYQINLAQRFQARYHGDEWQAYQKLEQSNGAPFSAFIRLRDNAVLSVSPERFLKLNQRQIETKPIKGTRPRSADPAQDQANAEALSRAEKDRAENLMIVDLLRNDIGRVAIPGSVRVPSLFAIESFPAVHHLVSTVTAELDPAKHSAADLLKACFPGGSITGAPKVRAMEIIEALEPHRRSVYCGSIGYISRCGRMDTSITIRTLITEQNQIFAWAGGGVVADSDAASEYQETLDKLSKILPIL